MDWTPLAPDQFMLDCLVVVVRWSFLSHDWIGLQRKAADLQARLQRERAAGEALRQQLQQRRSHSRADEEEQPGLAANDTATGALLPAPWPRPPALGTSVSPERPPSNQQGAVAASADVVAEAARQPLPPSPRRPASPARPANPQPSAGLPAILEHGSPPLMRTASDGAVPSAAYYPGIGRSPLSRRPPALQPQTATDAALPPTGRRRSLDDGEEPPPQVSRLAHNTCTALIRTVMSWV